MVVGDSARAKILAQACPERREPSMHPRSMDMDGIINENDLELDKKDPMNSLERRACNFLTEEIQRLERQLGGLKFVQAVMERYLR
jgi:hypothetical protein